MIRTHVLHADGHVRVDEGLALALSPPPDATVWVDMIATTEADLAGIPPEWRFHPLALEDCIHEQRRSKYERYPGHVFLVIHALDTATEADLDTSAVRIFVRPGLVVSVHETPLAALDRVDRMVLREAERVGLGADRVIHAIVDAIVDEFMHLLDRWERQLDVVEHRAETDREARVTDEFIQLRRNLLVMRRMMLPQQEVVKRLMDSPETTDTGRIYYRDVLDHMDAIADTAALLVEVCAGALQVQTERANERLNKVMKYLGIVSTLMLPMTVISGVFGMNFDVIPSAHAAYGFWTAIGLMIVSALTLLWWFRRKRWL